MNQSRFMCLKKFIKDAKEFINEGATSSTALAENLEIISSLDFSTLSCNRVDITLFFSSVWELMSCANAPHWSGVSMLISAVKDPVSRKLLIQTYRYMPILSDLLMKPNVSFEDKLKLLNLMEELSVDIKIPWQEPYLLNLLKLLCNWILNNEESHQTPAISSSSLSLLVNLCYKNMCVMNLLIEIVDTRNLFRYLITKKASNSESIQICRLLLSFRNIQGRPSFNDVRNYLGVSMQTLIHGIRDIQKRDLYYVNILLNDLCLDTVTKSHVLNYEHFESKLQEALKFIPNLLLDLNEDSKQCLHLALVVLRTLTELDLYSLRSCHKRIIELCIKTSNTKDLMATSYRILADIISQYEEEGMLPDDVASSISIGLRGLLDPISLDVKTAGVDWLSFVCSLNDCHTTRESILHNISVEKFEDILKEIIQCDCSEDIKEEAILIACHVSLSFVKREGNWEMCFHHILSFPLTHKIFNNTTNGVVQSRKKQFIQVLRHSDFPSNRIDEIFLSKNTSTQYNGTKDTVNVNDSQNSLEQNGNSNSTNHFLMHNEKLDSIILKVNEAFEKNELKNIPASHLLELYNYKMLAKEHRLNASNTSLQNAYQTVVKLNHSMAILEATSKLQEETLTQTQIHNEKLVNDVTNLSEQIGEAEKYIKKFEIKLATEKSNREQQVAKIETEYVQKNKELEEQMLQCQKSFQAQLDSTNELKLKLEEQLKEQINKNNELTAILIKFEEKVKQKEKKLEEANNNQVSLKNQLMESQQTSQTLEKTLLERERRLTQVTSQLEEMQRIQEMIANLMGNKGSSNVSTNSTN